MKIRRHIKMTLSMPEWGGHIISSISLHREKLLNTYHFLNWSAIRPPAGTIVAVLLWHVALWPLPWKRCCCWAASPAAFSHGRLWHAASGTLRYEITRNTIVVNVGTSGGARDGGGFCFNRFYQRFGTADIQRKVASLFSEKKNCAVSCSFSR